MDPDQIIARLGGDDAPTPEELASAKEALTAVKAELAQSIKDAKANGASLSELVALNKDYKAVSEGLTRVTEAFAEVQAELDATLADVAGGEGDDNADPADDGDDNETGDEAVSTEVVPVAASVRSVVERHASRMANRVTVVEPENRNDLAKVDTAFTLMGQNRDEISPSEIGEAFADAARRNKGAKTSVLSIKTELHPDRTLNGDASANERKLLDLFGANPVVPMSASGGCCSIPEPIYDQPMIGDLSRPIRAAFDVLNASRGAVQAYPPVCIPDEGADVWTCTQDAAVDEDDPDTWKSCTEIECEDSEPTLVEAAYKCLTIGTYQARFAPEQWEANVFQTDKLLARLLEARLFNWLAAAATAVYDTPVVSGSTLANFIKQQVRIAAAIRSEQRLGDAQIVTVGSNLIYSAILEDTLTRRLNATEDVEYVRAKVNGILANEGITYVGSDDVAAMGDPLSYSGDFPTYPGELPMVSLPAGSAKVLDGGEKNLGIDFTDLQLARQNKVATFAESWEGLLVRNCAVVFSTVKVEECDLGCPPVAS